MFDHPTVTAMLESAARKAEARAADPNRLPGERQREADRARLIRESLADAELLRSYVESMRDWLDDAAVIRSPIPSAMTDIEIVRAVRDHYHGGVEAFVEDEGDRRYLASTEDRMARLLANMAQVVAL